MSTYLLFVRFASRRDVSREVSLQAETEIASRFCLVVVVFVVVVVCFFVCFFFLGGGGVGGSHCQCHHAE